MNIARRFRSGQILPTLWLIVGCQGPLDGPGEPPAAPTIEVGSELHASLGELPRVFRLQVTLDAELGGTFTPEMLMLFSGELTSYYRGRLASAELPQTLLERSVESLSWVTATGFEVQPSRILEPGSYSLGLLGWGGLADLAVVDDGSPVLHRVWPPPGEGGDSGALYCANDPVTVQALPLHLAPDGLLADFAPNRMVPERCFELSLSGAPLSRVPPPSVEGALVDPVPLSPAESTPLSEPREPCAATESPVAAGCVSVMDDRLVVTPPREPQLWWLSMNGLHQAFETFDELPFVVAGLEPDSDQLLEGDVFDLSGHAERLAVEFRTLPALVHVAINEVYADANGPEPEQEWVELVNSGTLPVDFEGWVLEDVGGQTELPSALLQPGGFAVIVNEAYVPDADYDLLIDPLALELRVPALGKSGLSNSGELIRLRAPAGDIVSRFPGLPAERGRSVARKDPWSPDEDLSQFGPHADPGASPGAANQLAE